MSLRLRLLLTLAPLFILGLAAADFGTYAALQSSLLQGVDKQLVAIEPGVMGELLNGSSDGGGHGGYGQGDAFPAGTYGELVNSSGVTVQAGYILNDVALVPELILVPGVSRRHRQRHQRNVQCPGKRIVGVIQGARHRGGAAGVSRGPAIHVLGSGRNTARRGRHHVEHAAAL